MPDLEDSFILKHYQIIPGIGYPFILITLSEPNYNHYKLEIFNIFSSYSNSDSNFDYIEIGVTQMAREVKAEDLLDFGVERAKDNILNMVQNKSPELLNKVFPLKERNIKGMDAWFLIRTLPDFNQLRDDIRSKTSSHSLESKLFDIREIPVSVNHDE